MKILLVAVNAKYIHSNLAVYSLKANCGRYESQVKLMEYSINQYPEEILREFTEKRRTLSVFPVIYGIFRSSNRPPGG